MPTQLETFEYRIEKISGMTSDATISAESYYNDVKILLDVIHSINNYTLETDCPWCDLTDGTGHKDHCLLLPLFQKYSGITHKLPHPGGERVKRGPWEEGERRLPDATEPPRAVEHSDGYVGPARRKGPSGTVRKPVKPAGHKIWEVKETNKAMMEYKSSPENVAKLKARYEKGGWKEEMSFEMGAETTLVMSLSPRSLLAPFLEEIRSEERAAREALAATGGE